MKKEKILNKFQKSTPWVASTAAALLLLANPVHAAEIAPTPSKQAQTAVDYVDNGATDTTANGLLETLVDVLLFAVGAISVIMIIIGGIRFVVSRGDQQAAADARNTVLYAVIGVIVAVVAYGVINFVLGKLYG